MLVKLDNATGDRRTGLSCALLGQLKNAVAGGVMGVRWRRCLAIPIKLGQVRPLLRGVVIGLVASGVGAVPRAACRESTRYPYGGSSWCPSV